jgi:hypothetical protein
MTSIFLTEKAIKIFGQLNTKIDEDFSEKSQDCCQGTDGVGVEPLLPYTVRHQRAL